MSEVDGSYLVARTLKEENTECLFYLMGGPNYEIINNSEDLGIKTYDFRHEQAAAMAAHAYSRVTRKPGVTTAASGPGTLNLLTGQYKSITRYAPSKAFYFIGVRNLFVVITLYFTILILFS